MASNSSKNFLFFAIGLSVGVGAVIATVIVSRQINWGSKKPRVTTLAATQSEQTMSSPVTNQWYSSLFFKEWSEPIFAFPLAYKLTPQGVGISYPRLNATPKTVFGTYTEDLSVSLGKNFTKKTVVNPDVASIGVELCASEEECVTTRFTHGSPVTAFSTKQAVNVKISAPTQTNTTQLEKFVVVSFSHGKYLLGVKRDQFLPLSDIALVQDKTVTIKITPEDQLFIVLEPDGVTLEENQIGEAITGTRFIFEQEKSNKKLELFSSLEYLTKNGKEKPLVALLPHQWQFQTEEPLGSYTTLRGQMKLYQTNDIVTSYLEPVPLTIEEMASRLSPAEKTTLRELVDKETAVLVQTAAPVGVYENGKFVFKLAQLLEISQAVESSSTSQIHTKLSDVLKQWLKDAPSTRSSPFAVSEDPKGIIAKPAHTQFGNEVFNDHHFHYGYYIAATGILLENTPQENRDQLYKTLQPGLDALVTDIANTDPSNGYPLLRNFDPYESHSWADGRALAGDGNNQESTSEAITRWYGLYRLGKVLERQDLLQIGKVGWAMEQEATRIYWLGQRPELFQFPAGYEHPMASLVWGGKYDYATWFSAQPSHIYGIQFLPISPAMTHLNSPVTWEKYKEYGVSDNKEAWNDIYYMVAAANGEKTVNGQPIPTQLPKYEGGNTAPFYYLWISYRLKQP
jgi:endo-1,3(4)-beta-glucanase